MPNPEKIDYSKLGLKTGLEFHQRLDTHKLFCKCNSEMNEEKPVTRINRQIRPSKGEMGELDSAAAKEAAKNKRFFYDTYKESTCLVETDSEPPHEVNQEALKLALTIAKMLNCDTVDEVNFMRKTVIDGSNTTGFQRTAMIAQDGYIEKPFKLNIENIFLEEESAGVIGEIKGEKEYRLDRLGIPLVEIVTGTMQQPPEKVKEAALRIGLMLRTTGKVKRGIGTIRQDLNLSITQGNRVEIKGVQEIGMLEEIIENEVKRQLALIEVKKELNNRNTGKQDPEIKDFTQYFREEAPKFIEGTINQGGGVYGYILPKFKGILGKELLPGHRFGTELAGIAKSLDVPGIIHTDEDMAKYGIQKQIERIKTEKGLEENDSILLISEKKKKAENVLKEIKNRINQATEGIPQETRKALEDGYTQYLRPLGGRKRMYPETDIPTIKIQKKDREEAAKRVPPKPEEMKKKLIEQGISEELAKQTLSSHNLFTIIEIIAEIDVDPTLVASTLTSTIKDIGKNFQVDQLTKQHFKEVFKSLERKEFPKDALPEVIKEKTRNKDKEVSRIVEEKGLKRMSNEELKKEIKKKLKEKEELVKENPHRAFKVIVGEVMQENKGKVNGKKVSKMLKQELD